MLQPKTSQSPQLRKPWISYCIWLISFLCINVVFVFIQKNFHLHSFGVGMMFQEVGIVIITLLINRYYTKERLHFDNRNPFKRSFMIDFLFGWYLLLIFTLRHQLHHPVIYLFLAVFIGIAEELAFRGMLLSSFIHNWKGRHPLLGGILLSSLIFGATHVINAFSQPLSNTIIQIVVASALGIILALMYLRTNNLVTSMAFHAIIDFTSISITNSTQSQASWMSAFLITTIALLFLCFQLRPRLRQQIEREFNI